MRLLVTGADGQVGYELRRHGWSADTDVVALGRNELDITRPTEIAGVFARQRPDLVINAAAYTAVDRAESEPEQAWAVNCEGAGQLAHRCRVARIPLLHLSTDYVFDGGKSDPYVEDDPVNPLGVYGRSKEAGERAVRAELPAHVILRTAWVYGVHGHNFIKTMLRLGSEGRPLRVVADQRGSPTSARDIAGALATIACRLAGGDASWGTYHFAGAGAVTWHGFAEAIFAVAAAWRGPPPPVAAIGTADYPTPARRPANAVLDCARIGRVFGITPRPWREALGEVVAELLASAPMGQPS